MNTTVENPRHTEVTNGWFGKYIVHDFKSKIVLLFFIVSLHMVGKHILFTSLLNLHYRNIDSK